MRNSKRSRCPKLFSMRPFTFAHHHMKSLSWNCSLSNTNNANDDSFNKIQIKTWNGLTPENFQFHNNHSSGTIWMPKNFQIKKKPIPLRQFSHQKSSSFNDFIQDSFVLSVWLEWLSLEGLEDMDTKREMFHLLTVTEHFYLIFTAFFTIELL